MARLYNLAADALAAVVAYYATAGVALPDRQLVSLGQAPWDCELVNVWVLRDYPCDGNPAAEQLLSGRQHPGHMFRAAQLAVQVARCYPASEDGTSPPPLGDEQPAAAAVYADADLLWQALLAAETARTFSQPQGVAYEGWAAVGPGGAMAGGVLTIRALL